MDLKETLTEKIAGQPLWAWAGLAALAGAGVFVVIKSKQLNASQSSGTSSTTGPGTVPSGTTLGDIAGLPYGYDAGPFDNNPTILQGPAGTPGVSPTLPTTSTAFVRGRFSNTQVQAYDKANPKGVPVRSTPDGQIIGFAPFGTAVTITGMPVSGKSNLGKSVGSTEWLPVTENGLTGLISAYDLTGLQLPVGTGSGHPRTHGESDWAAVYNQHRNTVAATASNFEWSHTHDWAMN